MKFFIVVRNVLMKHKYWRIFFFSTKKRCDVKFQELNYNANMIIVDMTFINEETQHCTIYIDLCCTIFKHIVNENTSQLKLCKMFTKKWAWQFIEFFVRDDETNEVVQKLNIAKNEMIENDDLSINFEEFI
jgi:hypothetical protein